MTMARLLQSARSGIPLVRDQGQVKAERSHSGTAVTNNSEGQKRSFRIDQASDRFTTKTGYSQMDGTKSCVKDWFRLGRSGTPDPLRSVTHIPQTGHPPKPRYPVGWPCTRCDLKHMSKSHGWEVITEAQESLHRATVATSSAVRNRVAQRRVDAALPCPSPVNQ